MSRPTIVISANTAWNVLNFRKALLMRLMREGYRIVALTPADGYEPELRALGIEFVPIAMDRKGVSPRADAALLLRYWRALRRIRPVAYLGYTIKPNIYGSLAAQALGIPVINNVSGLGTAFISSGPVTMIVKRLYRAALRRSATVFFQNADDRDLFVRERLVGRQARLVPGSGIDPDHFAAAPLPGADGASVTFLLVARLLRDKGVHEYLAAARILKAERSDLQFQIVGGFDPDNATSLTPQDLTASQADGTIDYLGRTDDVRTRIAAADCVVLPSYREGLPRVLLEGGAMGRPLVATDVPGCRDLVEEGVNGFRCAARDARSLAGAMRRVAELSPADRAVLGHASRVTIMAGFGNDVVIGRYLDALHDIVTP